MATNESDEFSHWMSGTGDPDFEDRRQVDVAPRKRRELVQWLTLSRVDKGLFYEDTWRQACQKHPLNCLYALADLAAQENWPATRWSDALYAWGSERKVKRMWRYAAPQVQAIPNSVIQEIGHSITSWLQAVSKSINSHGHVLLDLCQRVLMLPLDANTGMTRNGEPINRPVTEAINHPVGHVTQALINLWIEQNPNDNDLLPDKIKPMFTALCDLQVDRFRHGRVLLGSRLITFFRVDRPWTEQYLLPLFEWSNPVEAKAAWEGFLWSPRLYQPLLTVFKAQFLDTAKHYAELGEHRQQFARLLTHAALGPVDGYTVEELRSAITALPQEGLEESAVTLSQALEGAADQREEYWKNRAQPFWQQIWPKSLDLATPRIAESLTRLVIAAGGEFKPALAAVKDWLQPSERPHYLIRLLYQSGICSKFPTEALLLLNTIITNQQRMPSKLGACLDEILKSAPELIRDNRYAKLHDYDLANRQ
jgi:hypothetical protein